MDMTKASPVRFSLLLLPVLGLAAWLVAIAVPGEGPAVRAEIGEAAVPERIRSAEERAFEQTLEEVGASLDGTVGIAVLDMETGELYEFNGDEMLPQQSVTKLWVAMTALAQVDAGEFDLSEPVRIRREDLTLFHQPIREIVKARGVFDTDYRDLLTRAITRSDNTANDRLLRRVGGPDAVEAWLTERGIEGVRFGTDERTKQSAIAGLTWSPFYSIGRQFYEARDRVPDAMRRRAFEAYLADPVDGASANAIARAMARLAEGELLSPRSTTQMRLTLAETRSGPRRLKGGVPEGWEIEHKTGTGQVYGNEQSGYNDVGLLTAPDGSEYAVAVMIGRTAESFAARMEMMQRVSRAVGDFHSASRAAPRGQITATAE